MESSRPYLTNSETAALLALSARRIHRYIAEGKLRAYRVTGEKTIRIKRKDMDALLSPVGDERRVAEPGDEHTRPRTRH